MSGVWFSETMLLNIKDLRILTWLSVRINLAHSFGEDRNIVSPYLLHDWSLGQEKLILSKVFHSLQAKVETVVVSNGKAQNYELSSPYYLWLLKEFTAVHFKGTIYSCWWCSWCLREKRDSQWDSPLFMVLKQAHQARAMATKTPLRSAQSPSYAVSLSVVPSRSPVVFRRALKTRTDKAQVIFSQLTIAFLTCFVLEKERGWWKAV